MAHARPRGEVRLGASEGACMSWTQFAAWLTTSPLWLIGAVLYAAAVTALAIGHLVGGRLRPALRSEPEPGEGLVVSAVFGLLALLLGFTFALAIDRFETRRVLVQEEANAIGTAFTRAQLLNEPHRSRIRGILLEFTANRIALAQTRPERARDLLATNDRLLADYWDASAAAFSTIERLDFSTAFIESVNEVLNVEATRKSTRLARVPVEVFALLMIYVVMSAGVLGVESIERRTLSLSALFVTLLTLCLLLVLDIDRPVLGGVREAQGPMERLLVTMQASEAD